MQSAWLSAASYLIASALVGVGILAAARVLRVRARRESPLKKQTYECGEEPNGMAWLKFHARYYVVALLFVIFDVEAALLVPWTVVLRELGPRGLTAAIVFVAVLMLGWLYALRKEALKWQ